MDLLGYVLAGVEQSLEYSERSTAAVETAAIWAAHYPFVLQDDIEREPSFRLDLHLLAKLETEVLDLDIQKDHVQASKFRPGKHEIGNRIQATRQMGQVVKDPPEVVSNLFDLFLRNRLDLSLELRNCGKQLRHSVECRGFRDLSNDILDKRLAKVHIGEMRLADVRTEVKQRLNLRVVPDFGVLDRGMFSQQSVEPIVCAGAGRLRTVRSLTE